MIPAHHHLGALFLPDAQGLFQNKRRTFEGPGEHSGVGQADVRGQRKPGMGESVQSPIISDWNASEGPFGQGG